MPSKDPLMNCAGSSGKGKQRISLDPDPRGRGPERDGKVVSELWRFGIPARKRHGFLHVAFGLLLLPRALSMADLHFACLKESETGTCVPSKTCAAMAVRRPVRIR
jgi:hypothetical protein